MDGTSVFTGLVGLLIGGGGVFAFFTMSARNLVTRAKQEAEQLRENALKEAQNKAKEIDLAAKQEQMRAKEKFEREHETLRRKLEERKIIERAKGILMERENISESAAYKILQRTSQSRNMSMAELSRSLLAAEDLMRPVPRTSGPPRDATSEHHGAR